MVDDVDADTLLPSPTALKAQLSPAAVVLGSSTDGKVHLVVASVDQPVVDRGLSAVDLIREIAPIVGGGGGGRPTMARAGGKDPDQLATAIAAAETAIRSGSLTRMKVLALDYGRARTGVAVSDSTGTLARPLTVVQKAGTAAGLRDAAGSDRRGTAGAGGGRPAADAARARQGAQARETLAFVERPARPLPGSRRDLRRAVHHDRWRGPPPARSTETMRWPPPICSRGT